jgi:general secretion pathway protein G
MAQQGAVGKQAHEKELKMMRTRRKKGFTLIEILLVLTLIGLMAGMAIFAIGGQKGPAQVKICKGLLDQIAQALETYSMQIGHYPTEEEGGLDALINKPGYASEALAAEWHGPYLRQAPMDPWGNKVMYQMNQAGSTDPSALPFKLWSYGIDGQDGTEDDVVYGVTPGATTK